MQTAATGGFMQKYGRLTCHIKTDGKEIPDRTFEEAAALAAHFSKGHSQDKVEVDYVLKKEVKKPAGSKPGFVVYYTNYSMIASTFIDEIKQC